MVIAEAFQLFERLVSDEIKAPHALIDAPVQGTVASGRVDGPGQGGRHTVDERKVLLQSLGRIGVAVGIRGRRFRDGALKQTL